MSSIEDGGGFHESEHVPDSWGEITASDERWMRRILQIRKFRRMTKGVKTEWGRVELPASDYDGWRGFYEVGEGLPLQEWRSEIVDVFDAEELGLLKSDVFRLVAIGALGVLPISGERREKALGRLNYDDRFDPEAIRIDLLVLMVGSGLAVGAGWFATYVGNKITEFLNSLTR